MNFNVNTPYTTQRSTIQQQKKQAIPAIIENKNELSTHATFHYGVEHYLSDYTPHSFWTGSQSVHIWIWGFS